MKVQGEGAGVTSPSSSWRWWAAARLSILLPRARTVRCVCRERSTRPIVALETVGSSHAGMSRATVSADTSKTRTATIIVPAGLREQDRGWLQALASLLAAFRVLYHLTR